jgi:hypothetical protein
MAICKRDAGIRPSESMEKSEDGTRKEYSTIRTGYPLQGHDTDTSQKRVLRDWDSRMGGNDDAGRVGASEEKGTKRR